MTSSTHPSRLIEIDLDRLLASVEDPVLRIREIIRDMDAAIADLRRETLDAVLRQKHLERSVREAEERAADPARTDGHVEALRLRDRLAGELARATALARRVKTELRRMQARVDSARHRKDSLVRRVRAAASDANADSARAVEPRNGTAV